MKMTAKFIKKAKPRLQKDIFDVKNKVSDILSDIKKHGDKALFEFCQKFDGTCNFIKVSDAKIKKAYEELDSQVIEDLKYAAKRIEEFSLLQKESILPTQKEFLPGVVLGHRIIPVASCAAYVPGGRYPLPSSALMSIIPARIAGVKRIVTCSPPCKDTGMIHPATLVAMNIAGAHEIYCMGGAHAIGALSFGTETVNPVDLIVGPGNQWVTEAKRQVSGFTGIDFLAGPSEVLIIADETSDSRFVAADLLAQSEHDLQARGILISTDIDLITKVKKDVEAFLETLPTSNIAAKAWEQNGEIILVESLKEAVEISNDICPEHLELHVQNPDKIVDQLTNYGSLFIGNWAAEVFGDYVSGTNHILPTMRASRYTGGVWVGTFIKVASFQQINREGAQTLAPIASRIARLEGLYAHKLAADVRKSQ